MKLTFRAALHLGLAMPWQLFHVHHHSSLSASPMTYRTASPSTSSFLTPCRLSPIRENAAYMPLPATYRRRQTEGARCSILVFLLQLFLLFFVFLFFGFLFFFFFVVVVFFFFCFFFFFFLFFLLLFFFFCVFFFFFFYFVFLLRLLLLLLRLLLLLLRPCSSCCARCLLLPLPPLLVLLLLRGASGSLQTNFLRLGNLCFSTSKR